MNKDESKRNYQNSFTNFTGSIEILNQKISVKGKESVAPLSFFISKC